MGSTHRAPDLESASVLAVAGVSVARCLPQAPAGTMAWHGTIMLLKEWATGFPEVAHRMSFPRSQGFSGPDDDHLGDIFQRAVVLDTLADFRECNGAQLSSVFQTEIEYLLRQKRTSGVGGWSYFPNLRELPADADDLAQVMQVLLRNRRRDAVEEHCDRPLAVLLLDNSRHDGAFETWIIPRELDSDLALQSRWAQIAWGTGPDREVVANLLYALWLYDSSRYRGTIERGVAFLASCQESDGSWTSTWYHGPLYGTWVCLRLLDKMAANSAVEARKRGKEFLARQQRSDGGWGWGATSDALSTSFALLGLAAGPDDHGSRSEMVDRGLRWLLRDQQADGGWSASPFIRMQLGRPTGRPWMTLSYGSRTISTAFAVKAALAWVNWEGLA